MAGFDEIKEHVTTPKDRVIGELDDLSIKIDALTAFLPKAKPAHHPLMLEAQIRTMQTYALILKWRLDNWSEI